MNQLSKQLSIDTKDSQLWQSYQQLKAEDRMLFPTEGAKALGVSELELLLASPSSQYIGQNCKEIMLQLDQFSRVESIVRNHLAVHEKCGRYENLKLGEKMGLAINVGGLDLRFFMSKWQHVLAIQEEGKADESNHATYSIQFFDPQGRAIEKVFLRDMSENAIEKWQNMVEKQRASLIETVAGGRAKVQNITIEWGANEPMQSWQYKGLSSENVEIFHKKWQAMTDVHQFMFLLRKLEIDRASSYRQAPEGMTIELKIEAVEALFELAKQQQLPIMIFVGNTGMVQIQTGPVHHIKRLGEWINILDKAETDFTLHLKDQALAQLWCVKRPTKDGIVTCIEGFDDSGTTIFSVFGQRLEGEPEREDWRDIVAKVCEQFAKP